MLAKYLAGLTWEQLRRFEQKVWDRIGDGGRYGWDWPTLWAVHPGYARVVATIRHEFCNRDPRP